MQEPVEWELQLTLTARKLKRVDIPQIVLQMVEQIEVSDEKLSSRLFLVLSELVNNALDHGLLELDSALKDSREGIELYYEERTARLAKLESGEIWLRLCKLADSVQQCLRIDVCDSGSGFDHSEVLARMSGMENARHGRGIALVKHMGGIMNYRGNGSEVHVCLPICEELCAYKGGRRESYLTLDCDTRDPGQ